MRTLPKLGREIVEQIEEAWGQPQPDWVRKRLLVVRLIAQHEHTVAEIMKIAGVCRQTVFTYRDRVTAGGVKALLQRDWNGARKPTVRGPLAEEFLGKLGRGEFRQARDAQAAEAFRHTFAEAIGMVVGEVNDQPVCGYG